MKNFKKVVAAAAAVAMTMSIGVSAFAEAAATYADGKVNVSGVTMDNGKQYTVIVIDADKADDTLEAADLYYINQGDNGETFWTNGLGVKEDLQAGEYIARIGGEDLAEVIEIPFTVGAAGTTYKYGDVNNDTAVSNSDALNIMFYGADMASCFDGYTAGDGSWIWIAADVNKDGTVSNSDALNIMFYGADMASSFDNMESLTFVK
jgi:hypothetical protein